MSNKDNWKNVVAIYFFMKGYNVTVEEYGFSFIDKKGTKKTVEAQFELGNKPYAIKTELFKSKKDLVGIVYPEVDKKYENYLVFEPRKAVEFLKKRKDAYFLKEKDNKKYLQVKINFLEKVFTYATRL